MVKILIFSHRLENDVAERDSLYFMNVLYIFLYVQVNMELFYKSILCKKKTQFLCCVKTKSGKFYDCPPDRTLLKNFL